MNLNDFDALSFDCYGTLIDWETGLTAVLRPWADDHGLDMTNEELLGAYASHEAAAEVDFPGDLYPAILARAMRSLGEQLGVPVSDDEAGTLANSVPDWPAFSDSAEASPLATRYQLIILSNIDHQSFAKSNERLGVTFTSVITAEDIGSYKPSPRNFEALENERQRLGISTGKLLHVAQSLFSRSRARPGHGAPNCVDQPATRHTRLGRDTCPAGARHAHVDVHLDGRICRRRRRRRVVTTRPPRRSAYR